MGNIYLHIPGIAGNVSAKGYQNWIALTSLQFYIGKNLMMQVGRQNDRYGARPHFSEIEVVKYRDIASPLIFSRLLDNTVLDQVEIHKVMTGDSVEATEKYVLKNVVISRFEPYVGQIADSEILNFNFTQLEMSYSGRNSANKLTSPLRSGYNLETAEVC